MAELRQQSIEHTERMERETQEQKRLIEQAHELSSMLKDAASPESKLQELLPYHGAESISQLLQLNARSFDVCKQIDIKLNNNQQAVSTYAVYTMIKASEEKKPSEPVIFNG